MKIHLYAVCWNEEKMLPFFLRHYAPLVDRLFIADDGSTDGTAEILRACPQVTLREFRGEGDSLVLAMQADANAAWKQSRGEADWVIFCDIDELLHHPDFLGYLERAAAKGVTIIPSVGYQMIADSFPQPDEHLPQTITRGAFYDFMNKTAIFNPQAIEEMNFAVGRHQVAPTGRVVHPATTEMKMLHYKYLGVEYLIQRHAELFTRRRKIDLARRYGFQYLRSPEENRADFEQVQSESFEVVD